MNYISLNETECRLLSDGLRDALEALNQPQNKELRKKAQDSLVASFNMLRLTEIAKVKQ